MKKTVILLFAALALATTATAQVEIANTGTVLIASSRSANVNWGHCTDFVTGTVTPVKMVQQDDAIHFTVWTNALKETKEFTIQHEQLANGVKTLVRFNNYSKESYVNHIVLTKNLFSFNGEYVLAIYLPDRSAILINENNEKVGEIPAGIIFDEYYNYGEGVSLGYIYYDNTAFLVGAEDDDTDESFIYSISCWADGKKALYKQADLSNDGQVDVTDVNKIIDIVLGRE